MGKWRKSFAGGFAAGVLFGVHERLSRRLGRPDPDSTLSRMTAFPVDVKVPYSDAAAAGREDCTTLPPAKCESNADCRKRCGPAFECMTVRAGDDVVFNGIALQPEESYCLPRSLNFVACKRGVSQTVASGDPLRPGKFQLRCNCLYPEIFAGYDCSTYVACGDPERPGRRAPLWDGWTDREVDLEAVLEEGMDLHQTMPDGTTPRFYCACKQMDTHLTSAGTYLSCIRDPCFPLAASAVSRSATGSADGSRLDVLNCGCGDPRETRLFGGGRQPCLPVMDPDCQDYEVDDHGEITCRCARNEVFVPCKNSYRRRGDAGECGMGVGAFMTRRDAPQAGGCTAPCVHCGGSMKACVDDPRERVDAVCDNTDAAEYDGGRGPSYACECSPNTQWVDIYKNLAEGRCIAKTPECRGIYRKCDYDIDRSKRLGPVCCRPCLKCNYTFGLCGYKPFCHLSKKEQ